MELEALVRRIRLGDKTAVKDLVAVYGNSVYLRALERTKDKELAREAARQTFGQFVSIVQERDEDGWSLWFGDLIERNIAAYAQIGSDMGYIEEELERELYGEESVLPQKPQPQRIEPPRQYRPSAREEIVEEPHPPAKKDKGARSSGRSSSDQDELFDEAYTPPKKKKGGQTATIVLLVVVCALLIWVVGGVAMTLKWIPFFDLGYSWFNTNIFRLF
jgi:hypothetical protein